MQVSITCDHRYGNSVVSTHGYANNLMQPWLQVQEQQAFIAMATGNVAMA